MTKGKIIKNKANLSGANLSRANLREANLSRANLSEASLWEANLSRANLWEANLSGANLSRANLWEANLSGANLSEANLSGANLSRANLSEAKNIPPQFKSVLNILKWQNINLIAFKYLNGNVSPFQYFKYEIGKEYIEENGNNDERALCEKGINLATLEWCLQKTQCSLEKTYAIFEFDPIDILSIPYISDGKFRVKKAKYIRNLTQEEIEEAIKPLYENY